MYNIIHVGDVYGLGGLPNNVEYVIDIGAGIGIFANHAFDKFPKLKKIVCLEPCKLMLSDLKKNTEKFGDRVVIENLTLGDGNPVYLGDHNRGNPDKNMFHKNKPGRVLEVCQTCNLQKIFEKHGIPFDSKFVIKADSFGTEDSVIDFENREYFSNCVAAVVKTFPKFKSDTISWLNSFDSHINLPKNNEVFALVSNEYVQKPTPKPAPEPKVAPTPKPAPKIEIKDFKAVYIVNGMRRSGIHAAVNWIQKNLEASGGKVQFINEVGINSAYIVNQKNIDYLIIGIEARGSSIKGIDVSKVHSDNIYVVNLLRNPANHIASSIKSGIDSTMVQKGTYHLFWLEYYHLYKSFKKDGLISVGYNFDKWFSDKGYRDQLANQLGFENTDSGLDAQSMDVLNRWKEYVNDPKWLNNISKIHNEMVEEFGEIDFTKSEKFNLLEFLKRFRKKYNKTSDRSPEPAKPLRTIVPSEIVRESTLNSLFYRLKDESDTMLQYEMVDIDGNVKFIIEIKSDDGITGLDDMRKRNYMIFRKRMEELIQNGCVRKIENDV